MNPLFGFAATALQDPNVRGAAGNVLGAGLRGAGRVGGYVGEGITGNIAQPLFNKAGDLGNQYLPGWLSGAGSAARRGLYGLGQAAVGAQGNQGIWDALNNRNMPQQQQQMGGMQQGGVAALQGLGGNQQPGMGMAGLEEAMQRNYMQEAQQPYRFDYDAQRRQLEDQYNQQTIPQMAQRFAGAGALGSSYFNKAMGGARTNLDTNLAALQELGRFREGELNQNRLGDIRQYLGGQQQIGLGARQLAQQGTIAQRGDAIRQLGLMGGAAQQQQGNYMDQLVQALNAQGNLANLGMNQPYQMVQQPIQPGPWGAIMQAMGAAIPGGIQAGANYYTGGAAGLAQHLAGGNR